MKAVAHVDFYRALLSVCKPDDRLDIRVQLSALKWEFKGKR